MATLDKIIIELDKLFKILNNHYYNGELIEPLIIVQSNGKNKDSLGWVTTKKVWENTNDGSSYYEITICAEFLDNEFQEISSTMLHEMAHLYNLQHDIKDVSRGNSYHNKRFKETAEKRGLVLEYDKRIGWSFSKLNEEAEKYINNINIDKSLFSLKRKTSNQEGKASKSSARKYACPICGLSVRATKEVFIKCGTCNTTMIKSI